MRRSRRTRIEVLGLAEAARRRPELFFGVAWDDPSLPTQVVRGVVLDLVSGAPRQGEVTVRVTVLGDHEVRIELVDPARRGSRPSRRRPPDPAVLPVRYGLTAAATGIAEASDLRVDGGSLSLRLTFDPERFAPGSALSRNGSDYTDATGAGPWLTPQMLAAVTIEDRRP